MARSITASLPILGAARTPYTSRHGALATVHPVDLLALVLDAVVSRSGLRPEDIEHLMVCVDTPVGAQALNLAGSAALAAGWPADISAVSIDGQGMGCAAVLSLLADGPPNRSTVLAAVDVTSIVPPGAATVRDYGAPRGPHVQSLLGGIDAPGPIADAWAKAAGITAEAANAEAERQLVLPAAASAALVPVSAGQAQVTIDQLRRESELSREPVHHQDGVANALNWAGWADGAAAVLIGPRDQQPAHQSPLGWLTNVALAGGSPNNPAAPLVDAIQAAGLTSTDTLALAQPSAAVQLGVLIELGREPSTVVRQAGILTNGSAPAVDDLRLFVDALFGMDDGDGTIIGRSGSLGSASACRLQSSATKPIA